MQTLDLRHQMVKATLLILFVVVLFATIFVPLVVKQNDYFTYMGLFNSALYGVMYAVVSRTKPARWHALLVCVGCFTTLVPLVVISGGVNSQFVVLFPMIPIPLALMSNSKVSWWISAFMIVLIFSLLLLKDALPDLTNEVVSLQKSRSRAIWVSFAIIISATFVMYFDRINRLLRHRLIQQAFEDELTTIANRRSIMQILQSKLVAAHTQPIAVLMIDVDYFKQFNDKYGHLLGDECLKAVAQSIKRSIRQGVDDVGRYGGEEFLVILDNVAADNALNIAEKIRANIALLRIAGPDGSAITVTVTIGLCCVTVPKRKSAQTILQQADQALYQGKLTGRNRVEIYNEGPVLN